MSWPVEVLGLSVPGSASLHFLPGCRVVRPGSTGWHNSPADARRWCRAGWQRSAARAPVAE